MPWIRTWCVCKVAEEKEGEIFPPLRNYWRNGEQQDRKVSARAVCTSTAVLGNAKYFTSFT